MHVEDRNGYRVVVGAPVPPQADAITLGRTILVRDRAADNQGLLAHELVHVRQFINLGPLRFLAKYVGSYLRFRLNGYGHMAAYRRIPLEVEASWLSRLHSVAELEPSTSKRKLRSKKSSPVKPQSSLSARPSWPGRRAPRRNLDAVTAAMTPRSAS